MSVNESKERRRERARAQAQHRREQAAKASAKEAEAEPTTQTETEVAIETATETAAPSGVPSERDKTWQGYCKYAVSLHRRPNELAQFEIDLQAGRRPDVTEPAMMIAALALVSGMAEAGVRRRDFLPPPSADGLRAPAAWVGQRLADQRVAQYEAERVRRQQRKLAQALGQSARGNGTGRPVYAQRLKRPLAEVGDCLERVMTQHQAEHGEFKRHWLDPNSPHFIAGITNKEIIMMASEITGIRTWRSFEENWKIVTDWLRERRTQNPSSEAT